MSEFSGELIRRMCSMLSTGDPPNTARVSLSEDRGVDETGDTHETLFEHEKIKVDSKTRRTDLTVVREHWFHCVAPDSRALCNRSAR